MSDQSYTAEDIYVLEGLEPVRKRPGMYIGSTGTAGLHHLIWEVIDNSIDEAMAGFAKNIEVTLYDNNQIKVTDDGRGIPVDIHKQTKKSALETVMTTLHAGGKFGGKSYQVAGGLHGVGVSVVCALSSYLRAEVCRDGKLYVQEYERGKPKAPVKAVGKCQKSGTSILFEPDSEIFFNGQKPKEHKFSLKTILDHLRQQAYLTPGIKIIVKDERTIEKEPGEPRFFIFYFEDGIKAFLKHLIRGKEVEHPNIFTVSQKYEGNILVEAALQYTKDFEIRELSFANNIYTPEGGMHLTGFRSALTKTINKFAKENNFFNSKENSLLTREDVEEGLAVIVSVKLREPQFEGQTKAKLGNPEARTAVENIISEAFYNFLKNNPQDASLIVQKSLLAQKARIKAKAVKETILRKGVLTGLMLPGKLTDCASRNPEESELFIVEGDSAGGSARQGRNPKFQAILPLKGKILNVEKARLSKMLDSKEIKALIVALGTAIAEEFNLDKLRYHKIILMSDADVDGLHIQTLLLTLFYRHFKPIIERGYLYIAQPPLYRITNGKEVYYAFSDQEKEEIVKKIKSPNPDIQRYKGLGEMNPEQLWETTMDPDRRFLYQVTIEDAEYADKMFDMLMGDEVLPRKKFIEAHAKDVVNLDV